MSSTRYKKALAISIEYERRAAAMSPEELDFSEKGEDLRRWYSELIYTALRSKACSSEVAREISGLVEKHNPMTEDELYREILEITRRPSISKGLSSEWRAFNRFMDDIKNQNELAKNNGKDKLGWRKGFFNDICGIDHVMDRLRGAGYEPFENEEGVYLNVW
jgi:hypothetical protein